MLEPRANGSNTHGLLTWITLSAAEATEGANGGAVCLRSNSTGPTAVIELSTSLTPLCGGSPMIMTLQDEGDFALEGHKFTAQHGNTIEVRQYQLG